MKRREGLDRLIQELTESERVKTITEYPTGCHLHKLDLENDHNAQVWEEWLTKTRLTTASARSRAIPLLLRRYLTA